MGQVRTRGEAPVLPGLSHVLPSFLALSSPITTLSKPLELTFPSLLPLFRFQDTIFFHRKNSPHLRPYSSPLWSRTRRLILDGREPVHSSISVVTFAVALQSHTNTE